MAAILEKLAARLKTAAKGSQDACRALQELRALAARLRDERAEVLARPIPLAEAQSAAASAVMGDGARLLGDLSLAELTRPTDGRTPTLRLTADQRAALAFAAAATEVVKVLTTRLADHYRAHNLQGIGADARAAELARIDAEALATELAEESVIRGLEAMGLPVLRRADADPRALLADDRELK